MEFGQGGHVLVNPLRVKDNVLCELEASILLFYTGASRASAEIIAEQSRNVETGNKLALDAMHRVKQEAFRMKDALLRRRIEPSSRSLTLQLGGKEADVEPDRKRADRGNLRESSRSGCTLCKNLRCWRRWVHVLSCGSHVQGSGR